MQRSNSAALYKSGQTAACGQQSRAACILPRSLINGPCSQGGWCLQCGQVCQLAGSLWRPRQARMCCCGRCWVQSPLQAAWARLYRPSPLSASQQRATGCPPLLHKKLAWIFYVCECAAVSCKVCICEPWLYLHVRSCENLCNACCRGFAFSLFYSFMNMAALLCASVLDLFRVKLRHGFNIASLPANHFLNDGTRLLLFMGAQHPRRTIVRVHHALACP